MRPHAGHTSSRFPAENVHLESNHGEIIRPPETVGQFIGLDPPEEEMATCSSIVAWETPWTESLEGDSPWDHKDGHDCVLTHSFKDIIKKKKHRRGRKTEKVPGKLETRQLCHPGS